MTTQTSVNNEFRNNLTVSESAAGNSAILTVNNEDNTNAASHSYARAITGGASAGDAFIHFDNQVVDWVIGVDNSDSDAFVISKSTTPGTTNVAKCVTTGEWVYPLQPGFNASKSNLKINASGTGTLYKIVGDTVRWNQNNDFSNATGDFTAPVTGKYLLTGVVYITGATIMNFTQCNIITSNATYNPLAGRPSGPQDSGAMGTVIADMDAGDTANMYVSSYGEAGDTDDVPANLVLNHFSGVLLQ